jgi:hypothetical protein
MIKKIIIGAVIAIVAVAGGSYYYAFVYMKNRKFDMVNAEATSITSVDLVKAFQTDEAGSNAAYLDKVLQITGTVSATGTTQNAGGAPPAPGESPDMGGGEMPPAPEPAPPGGEMPMGESKRDNLNILLENDDILGEKYLDLSKGRNSLGSMEDQLNKLLND